MALFDLAVEGVVRLRRATLFAERPIAWEPLSGPVNAVNDCFRVRDGPVKPDSLTVYVSNVEVEATLMVPDVVVLASAPAAQPYASYMHQALADRQAKQLLMDGVTELEMRWPRGWRLSKSGASYVAAMEDDDHIYVISKSAVADPALEVALSTSENQKGLVMACAQYVYRLAEAFRAAQSAITMRGTAGGMTLDRRGVPDAMMNVLALLDVRLKRQTHDAQVEWTGGESLGGAVHIVVTRDYMTQYEWQTASILENWYETYKYDPSDVDLEAVS